jgi:hypothetical protein
MSTVDAGVRSGVIASDAAVETARNQRRQARLRGLPNR